MKVGDAQIVLLRTTLLVLISLRKRLVQALPCGWSVRAAISVTHASHVKGLKGLGAHVDVVEVLGVLREA
jgi:hypothetical protein